MFFMEFDYSLDGSDRRFLRSCSFRRLVLILIRIFRFCSELCLIGLSSRLLLMCLFRDPKNGLYRRMNHLLIAVSFRLFIIFYTITLLFHLHILIKLTFIIFTQIRFTLYLIIRPIYFITN